MRVQLFEIITAIQCAKRAVSNAEIFGNQDRIASERGYMQAMIGRYEALTGACWNDYADNNTSLALVIDRVMSGEIDVTYGALFAMNDAQIFCMAKNNLDAAWLITEAPAEFRSSVVAAAWQTIESFADSAQDYEIFANLTIDDMVELVSHDMDAACMVLDAAGEFPKRVVLAADRALELDAQFRVDLEISLEQQYFSGE